MTRVLIVDPDREFCSSLEKFLKSEGFEAAAVYDGEEALRSCKESLPNILITEGLLPRLGGFDLAKEVRKLTNGGFTSILLISAIFSAPKYKKQVQDARIDNVMSKPFTYQDILDTLHTIQISPRAKSSASALQESPITFNPTGLLSEVPFVRLVFEIYRDKMTGTLRLQSQTTKKLVTFENGEPRFVVSNLEQECLGQILVKKGKLTAEECKQSLESMAKLNKRQGETLIQMGLIEPFELEDTLKFQAREKFCEIFAWREGQYIFVPGKVFKKELTAVDLTIPQLCLRGVKEHYSMATLLSVLNQHIATPPTVNPHSIFTPEDFKFATWDMRVWQQIKKGKTITDVLEMHIARDIDVYQLFLTLQILELIQFLGTVSKKTVVGKPKPVISGSPFELLGVNSNSTDEEIATVYETKMGELAKNDNLELRFAIKNAFDLIASAQGRRDYLVRIYEEEGALPPQAHEFFKPAELLNIGKNFLKKKEGERARKVFQDGATLFPENGLFFCYFGFTVYSNALTQENPDPKEKERALKAMIKGAQLSPDNEEIHLLLGRAFALDKNYEKATLEFQKVLNINPKHKEAASELRLAQMRLEKKKTTSFVKWK